MVLQQHEIDAAIESAMQTKARKGYTQTAAVYRTWHSARKFSLGWNFRQGLEVGKTYEHADGSKFEVLALV